ncbi:ABC transporter permease [Roseibacillus ishigakijimensis]|uniref:ABC transporter permease n=1 Tax=Roseibacillus ishigakijimensis TaxID=454146 RepID=A0A934RT90_9BACT|nr:ABC transporter permease [Roseibacillus ishigakijimensis]MBK1835527.1 ABC transporter permease [Roseibacillus ishigakijimensis]
MKDYFLRRLLLVPVTMLGVTFLVFLITRAAPGGPLEKAMMEAQIATEGGGSGGTQQQAGGLDEETIEANEEEYGYDKPVVVAYLQWLGLWQRERALSKSEFYQRGEDSLGSDLIVDPDNETIVVLKEVGREVFVRKEGSEVQQMYYLDNSEESLRENGWKARIESPLDRQARWARREGKKTADAPDYKPRVVIYQARFSGVLQGDFGHSKQFGDPVLSLIASRIPVALYFGILTTIITYAVCLPLGIVKAIKHRTFLDNASSVLIFVGYAVPGFALGALMVVYLAARAGWFPMFGLDSPELADLEWWRPERLLDRAHHTVLPLLCYVVGSFAFLTMMMKNSLMDNLASDYVRTAVAKGVSYRRAIFKHAFRNSIIPVASTLGQLITILVSGSILIESVFDIQGFGLLQFQALEGRDTPVIMGTLTIAAFLLVVGNILSDFIVAMIDPRVKFN